MQFHPRAFLITTYSFITISLTIAAASLAPIEGNKAGSPTAFSFFSTLAAASAALTLTCGVETIAARR